MTRCKPNSLAWISRSAKPSQIGMVVRVERLNDYHSALMGEPIWVISFPGAVLGVDDTVCVGEAGCRDADMTPITPPGLTEEVTTDELIGVEA